MIILLLGLLDLISGISVILSGYQAVSLLVVWAVSLYLILKGVVFIKSWASALDIVIGVGLLMTISNTLPIVLFWIAGLYLVQKGIFSFFVLLKH